MKITKNSHLAILAGATLFFSNMANAEDRYSQYMYVGTELGLSEPVVKSFVENKAKFRLKQSKMYGGRIGYSFYPGMMIELSGTYQPKYGFTYMLPETEVTFQVPGYGPVTGTISKTPGKTKVISNVYTLNWIYEIPKQIMGIKPYVILGAGVARITIKPTFTTTNDLERYVGKDFEYFRLKKNTINCFAWQAGGGVTKDISENFSIDLGAKLQVVNNIKLKYDTYVPNEGFVAQKPIKKTIGVGEFTLGFTFKIPVNK